MDFEIVRITSAEPFKDYEKTVKERIQAGLYPEDLISYEEILEKVEIYADPSNIIPNPKSIISMAFCYYSDKPTDLTKSGEPHGVLARAYQDDVYGTMFRQRDKFSELLRKKGIGVAKSSLIPNKMAAVRAGIGFQGKNSLILTKKFGSWVLLNNIIIDAEFEADEPSSSNCGSCKDCMLACPTSAIESPGVINVNKCIDYLTCKTGVIPKELRGKMGNSIVSCDRCQEACPHNKAVKPVQKEIPSIDPNYRHSPTLLPLLSIAEKEFKKFYLDCDFIDPRSETLQRNVIVALGNVGDPIAIPALQRFQKSATPLLKEHVEWALKKLIKKN